MVKIRVPKKIYPLIIAVFCGLIIFNPIIGIILRELDQLLLVAIIAFVSLFGAFNIYLFFQEENDINLIVKNILGPFSFIYHLLAWAIALFTILFLS